jgi:hypothetical protein
VRLGKRPSRIRVGGGRQLIRSDLVLLAMTVFLLSAPVSAQMVGGRAASIGPARIVCNASFCQMGSGARPKERFRVIVSDLPKEEIHRLRKCTGVAKPCIVTIEGIEQSDAMKIMATGIHWQDQLGQDQLGQDQLGQDQPAEDQPGQDQPKPDQRRRD